MKRLNQVDTLVIVMLYPLKLKAYRKTLQGIKLIKQKMALKKREKKRRAAHIHRYRSYI